MQDLQQAMPLAVAGIRNFGWVVPGVLARGEQPPLTDETFSGLRELGIGAILSLRPDREPPSAHRRISSPLEYHVEQEQALAERHGLRFGHAPIEDFSAPPPAQMAAALEVLDGQMAQAPPVYVHCRAGAGRAALVSGAWLVAQGGSGDQAAALYEGFLTHLGTAVGLSEFEWNGLLHRIGQPQVWWALCEISAALGSSVTRATSLLPALRPVEADAWTQDYWSALAPWRTLRGA
jgi:protein tyrosine phosphatase (PTP) superfamily phosphohydrolase (DUF442 family)